jgi:hypothetical protein
MKFISKYSNNKEVTPAQFITEMICEKRAQYNKEDLHFRFWTTKKWSTFFRNQIATANKLVQEYDPVAIVKALKNPKTKFLYSLRAPSLKAIIQQEQDILNSQNKQLSKTLERKEVVEHKRPSNTKNILSKLKELDNDC